MNIIDQIVDGRTDLGFEYVSGRYGAATATDRNGVSLIKWCAYYGDVSAIKFLLTQGEVLGPLGFPLDLNAAAFHGHWRLCQFLIENGADVNRSLSETGETPLHAALCKTDRVGYDLVVSVLLQNGADPNRVTKVSSETGGFARDCRTIGETPLHRAAAFGTEKTITLLLDAGATLHTKDANGDTPLTWASWYLRPGPILRLLCYGKFKVREGKKTMAENLQGVPHFKEKTPNQAPEPTPPSGVAHL